MEGEITDFNNEDKLKFNFYIAVEIKRRLDTSDNADTGIIASAILTGFAKYITKPHVFKNMHELTGIDKLVIKRSDIDAILVNTIRKLYSTFDYDYTYDKLVNIIPIKQDEYYKEYLEFGKICERHYDLFSIGDLYSGIINYVRPSIIIPIMPYGVDYFKCTIDVIKRKKDDEESNN